MSSLTTRYLTLPWPIITKTCAWSRADPFHFMAERNDEFVFFWGGGFHLIKWNYFLGVRMSSSWLTLTLHLDEFGVSLRLQFCFVCLGYLWFKINNYIFTFCVAPNWFLPCIERTALFIFMLCLSLAVNLLNFIQRTILILHYCFSVVTLTLICLLLRGRICELQPISPHMQRTKHSAEWSGSHVG